MAAVGSGEGPASCGGERRIPLSLIAQNPNHAQANKDTLLENVREMQNHEQWCEKWWQQSPLAPGPKDHEDVAELVARLMSAGLNGELRNKLRAMATALRPINEQVSAEMMWIMMTCDPEDEQYLFCCLATLARKKMAISMDEDAFKEASVEILIQAGEKIRMYSLKQVGSGVRAVFSCDAVMRAAGQPPSGVGHH